MRSELASMIIEFKPELPCGTFKPTKANPNKCCGKLARFGYVTAVAPEFSSMPLFGLPRAGEWVLLPICEDCTKATAKVYGINLKAENED